MRLSLQKSEAKYSQLRILYTKLILIDCEGRVVTISYM